MNIFRVWLPLCWAGVAAMLTGCANHAARPVAGAPAFGDDPGVTLYAAGDIADCRHTRAQDAPAADTAALVAAGLAADPAALVLTLGDHTYPDGRPQEFARCYEPTWGRFKSHTFPTPGNHEYHTGGAGPYYDYFGARARPTEVSYYSFNRNSWHIIALNSELPPAQHAAQLAWLKADLAASAMPCTLAYWHRPVYSSGGHLTDPTMQDAWQALAAAGAEIVLAGHDHDYERFAPQDGAGRRDDARGVAQFVVGTGGAPLTPILWRRPHSAVAYNRHHGVLKLVLRAQGYEWEFLPVGGVDAVDRGSLQCH